MSDTPPTTAAPRGRRPIPDVLLVEDNPIDRRLAEVQVHRSFTPKRWRDCANARAALDLCLTDPPELLLLDFHLPDMHGLELLRLLRNEGHTFPVIVMTGLPEKVAPGSLLELGVIGYFDKSTFASGLPQAINGALDGRIYFSASRSPFSATPNLTAKPSDEHTSRLSVREKEVARLVAHGFASKQIALHLNLSVRTVENHRARIMARMDLVNAADLVRWCLMHGIE